MRFIFQSEGGAFWLLGAPSQAWKTLPVPLFFVRCGTVLVSEFFRCNNVFWIIQVCLGQMAPCLSFHSVFGRRAPRAWLLVNLAFDRCLLCRIILTWNASA